MAGPTSYKLTWFIYSRWAVATLAFTALVPLLFVVVEFPVMLLVAMVSRLFGKPEFAGAATGVINSLLLRPEVLALVSPVISFFVLRAILAKAIGRELDGKVLVLQDAPTSEQ